MPGAFNAGIVYRLSSRRPGLSMIRPRTAPANHYLLRGPLMQTAVTKRGQTVIPAAIRKRYHIDGSVHLVWLDDGETIRAVPVPKDPLRALRGRGRGERLRERLPAERQADRDRETRS